MNSKGAIVKQSELDHILDQHKLWLESNGNKGKRTQLTDANLFGANLTNANLTNAYLYRAKLSDADLTNANLSDAYLTGANLSGAYLTSANLTGACLTNANLTGACLTDSILNSKYMYKTKVDQFQLSWLATDPNFCDWVDKLDMKKEAA